MAEERIEGGELIVYRDAQSLEDAADGGLTIIRAVA
jgi:hypothetical protein